MYLGPWQSSRPGGERKHTSFVSCNAGALTKVGFLAWEKVRHAEVTMNRAEGKIEKNNCSN